MRAEPVTFFVIDDDDVDVQAIERALWDIKISNPTIRARDGVEALEMLRGENGHDKLSEPLMLFLDLNMPRMGGLDFLGAIQEDEDLKKLTVMVLTTSDSDQDIINAYKFNIHSYIVKDDLRDSLHEALEELDAHRTIVASV